jgi:stage V sporulation protein R
VAREHEIVGLPRYLRQMQEEIEGYARGFGLDFFPVIFEVLTFEQMNEVAAYAGFPNRYPHWRFGMEYERLSKSYRYGLSKIYEMVINNNPTYAYLLEGNSLVDQKLVMAHVYGHVDFFKNNHWFAKTERRMMDEMANHGTRVRRYMERWGVERVEEFIDTCLCLDNLIDPHAPFIERRGPPRPEDDDQRPAAEIPRLRSKDYMQSFINPEEFLESQRKRLEDEKRKEKRFPPQPERDVLLFMLEHAPLERWERDVLEIVREEAYYFAPQAMTKVMNEGWASFWHSKIMTEKALTAAEVIDYADHAAGVLATDGQSLNPYKLGVELYRDIEDRWNRGRFGKEWEECDSLERRQRWDRRLGQGLRKVFQVRALYNDVTFIDEFLTLEFCKDQKLFSFGWSNRNERWEIETREFDTVKKKLLFQLTNMRNPFVFVDDANFLNRGELLLRHQHEGIDLRLDHARESLRALFAIWKRPVVLHTIVESKPTQLRFDGNEHTSTPLKG